MRKLKSIVLVELYMEPSSVTMKPAQERIRGGITEISAVFRHFFCGVLRFSQARGVQDKKRTPGIDRARRYLLGDSVGLIGASS